jgi:signal transduction histidine kinase
MNYQLLIDNSPVVQGNVINVIFLVSMLLCILVGAAVIIWKRVWGGLKENEILKAEFITIIAHKFRTPLTQLKWMIEGMLADEKDSYRREILLSAEQSNRSLIDLTGQLVELADSADNSKTSYSFEAISLCEVVKKLADSMKGSFHEKNIFFSVQCASDNIMVRIDRVRFEFVLQALLENARTYSPPGRNVEVGVGTDRGKAVVTVTDHGIGIAQKDLPRIFTKFYRGDNAQRTDTEGFGIGLYMAGTVIARHHGTMNVYSAGLDKGSTFTVTLPLAK